MLTPDSILQARHSYRGSPCCRRPCPCPQIRRFTMHAVKVWVNPLSSLPPPYIYFRADWRLHVYDTKAPFGPSTRQPNQTQPAQQREVDDSSNHETTMKTIKTVKAVPGSWTITDVCELCPAQNRIT